MLGNKYLLPSLLGSTKKPREKRKRKEREREKVKERKLKENHPKEAGLWGNFIDFLQFLR